VPVWVFCVLRLGSTGTKRMAHWISVLLQEIFLVKIVCNDFALLRPFGADLTIRYVRADVHVLANSIGKACRNHRLMMQTLSELWSPQTIIW
jgi:hypothetical protein